MDTEHKEYQITTVTELYSIVAEYDKLRERDAKIDIRYEQDKRRKGINTTLYFTSVLDRLTPNQHVTYITIRYRHTELPLEVNELVCGRYCATTAGLLKSLDRLYPTLHRVSLIDDILADLDSEVSSAA